MTSDAGTSRCGREGRQVIGDNCNFSVLESPGRLPDLAARHLPNNRSIGNLCVRLADRYGVQLQKYSIAVYDEGDSSARSDCQGALVHALHGMDLGGIPTESTLRWVH